MTREKAITILKNLGWDEIGSDEIVTTLEDDNVLESMTEDELVKLSDDYIDR